VISPTSQEATVTEESTQQRVRASDADRDAAVSHLQQALAEGRLGIDDFGRRAEAACAAETTAELEPLVADLPGRPSPGPAEMVGRHAPTAVFDAFANVRVEGGAPVPRRAGAVFGDIRMDLRQLRTDAPLIELDLWSVFGDVDVVVAEGVDAELDGWTLLGKRRTDLAPVPRLAGTPRVAVRAHTVFGDLRLRSLAPGESAGRWRALLDRLAQRGHAPGAHDNSPSR
jgi:hypothetical protein